MKVCFPKYVHTYIGSCVCICLHLHACACTRCERVWPRRRGVHIWGCIHIQTHIYTSTTRAVPGECKVNRKTKGKGARKPPIREGQVAPRASAHPSSSKGKCFVTVGVTVHWGSFKSCKIVDLSFESRPTIRRHRGACTMLAIYHVTQGFLAYVSIPGL